MVNNRDNIRDNNQYEIIDNYHYYNNRYDNRDN